MAESRHYGPRRRHWPQWLFLACGILAGLLWIAQDQETLRVKSPVDALDPRFADYVASLVAAPIEIGDAFTVLRNGDEAFPAMLEAIDGAKSRIVFESYVFKDGEIGKRWVAALEAAAKRGVSVRVVLDAIGATMAKETEERLKAAGIQVLWFNPVRFWQLEDTNYRTHRKVLVVDGEVGFLGGMGVDDQWTGHAQDAEQYNKGINYELDIWGEDMKHDWPTWRSMLPYYLESRF